MLDLQVGVTRNSSLQAQFDKLKKKASQQKLTKALQAGGEVFKHAIEERTPVRSDAHSGDALAPGAVKADIQVKTSKGIRHAVTVNVGPSDLTERVMRLLEYGHRVAHPKSVKGKLANAAVGYLLDYVAPHPVMRPAWEASQEASMRAVIDILKGKEE